MAWSSQYLLTQLDIEFFSPEAAGVYRLFDCGELVYIGRSESIQQRLLEHHAEGKKKATRFDFNACQNHELAEGILLAMHEREHGRLPRYNARRESLSLPSASRSA